MSNEADRRTHEASRVPFDAMVEVGGSLGPSFEAQAVNVSEEGMHLRTAYLPDVGQPVTCRFDAGSGLSVVAAGEVLWRSDLGQGGEFGIRFTNLDAPSASALQRIIGLSEDGMLPRSPQGRKVRLHIDGLAAPMRARVRETHGANVTAFSELGFLQVGKPLELEDAMSGSRRPASIDSVAVEVDGDTRIPQLVVTLRYDDEESIMSEREEPVGEMHDGHDRQDRSSLGGLARPTLSMEGIAPPPHDEPEEDMPHASHVAPPVPLMRAMDDMADEGLKGTLARKAAEIGPAMGRFAVRAKTTIALLAAKATRKKNEDLDAPMRRTTAPPPGGGLTTAGRKVVRSEPDLVLEDERPGFKMTKKKGLAVAGAALLATTLAVAATHKSAGPVAAVASPAPVETAPVVVAPAAPVVAAAPPPDPLASAGQTMSTGRGKNGKPLPFGSGGVGHGNVIKIKMDGPIDRIEGASQPTGFTVVIPGRKALDAKTDLAPKDPRILNGKVTNEPAGTELTVAFKDGVPNYQVRAKGDTLEMVLAKATGPSDRAAETHPKKRHVRHH